MSLRKNRKKEAEISTVDQEEEEPLIEKIYRRIKAPIIWEEFPPCYYIQDMHPNYYDVAIELMKSSFMQRETMCKSINIVDEQESVEGYEDYLRTILKDNCSLMCLCTETNELVGVIVLKIMHKSDFGKVYSRVKMTQGDKFLKVLELQRYLNRKSSIYEIFECNKYLRLYLIDIHSDHKGRDINLALLRSACKLAKCLGIDVIMGIFTSAFTQLTAKLFGMVIVNEIYYVDWLDEKKNMVFDDPGVGNYTCALMAGKLPPPRMSLISI